MSDSPLLSFSSLAFERDDAALFSRVDGEIAAGDILQIEGPNGCGKTTLLRMLATSLRPSEGVVFWQGQPITNVRQRYLRDVLFIGHQPAVKLELTPLENLNFWRCMMDCDSEIKDGQALETLQLRGYEDSPCFSLSAGQLRRVSLARLLISPSRIWLLDEPFTAIDREGVEELSGLLSSHAKQGGVVILSTHQPIDLPGMKRLDLSAYTGARV